MFEKLFSISNDIVKPEELNARGWRMARALAEKMAPERLRALALLITRALEIADEDARVAQECAEWRRECDEPDEPDFDDVEEGEE